jgi:hypothetical protein
MAIIKVELMTRTQGDPMQTYITRGFLVQDMSPEMAERVQIDRTRDYAREDGDTRDASYLPALAILRPNG